MKKISNQLDNKLLDYLDGTLAPADKERLEQEMAASPELRSRFEELQTLTHSLAQVQVEQPSATFTQRVMAHLDQLPVRSTLSIRNSILLLAGVLVAVIIGSLLLASGIFDTPGTINLNELVENNKYIQQPLPSIPFNGKLVVNIIILLNIALAFLVLDRAVLKPWFERRTRMHF